VTSWAGTRSTKCSGFTGWQANVPLVVDGSRYVIDVLFRLARLAIEVDGRQYHGDATFESDRWRQNALVLDGWRVLRFTWTMLNSYPDRVTAMVLSALGDVRKPPSRSAA
jgi:very-short-patch-repair endonuclease